MTKFPAWVYLDIKNESIKRFRDTIYEELESISDSYEKERNLHVTIHPGIIIYNKHTKNQLNKLCRKYNDLVKIIEIGELKYHPSKENPRVIYLECQDSLYNLRGDIRSLIVREGCKEIDKPVKPHITLCKVEDNADIKKYSNKIICNIKQKSLDIDKIKVKSINIDRIKS